MAAQNRRVLWKRRRERNLFPGNISRLKLYMRQVMILYTSCSESCYSAEEEEEEEEERRRRRRKKRREHSTGNRRKEKTQDQNRRGEM
ncbi:hypothetical protein E2C01_091120 [Portunus trituberculatus]|uniref:Uncharacterized protein n=1 Tax=Portunus trituberculatus TaxID=210409 RepID=A0A5B7JD59_PORTR|nr:hypothetical protein [Portunus trituberculatus]